MPRIRRATRRDRAETAPHTPSHTTSFCPRAHSDLLWKHRDSHTSLLSNCHIVPRLPRSLLSNLHIFPRLPRDWAIQVWATCWLCWPIPHLHQHYIANSNHALLPPIYLHTPKFQRKAMPRIRRATRRDRAETAPHTPSHTTSFCPPAHSDLITVKTQGFAHFLTFKLPHCPTPATFFTFNLAHYPTPATWLSYCELPLDYSTTGLGYCELPHDYSTIWLSYCELPLDYSTTWLSYCELPLDYSTTGLSYCELPLDYSTTWLSYCELPLDYSTTGLSYCELPLDYSTTWRSYCELPLDYSTTWLSYPIVRNYGSF